MSIHSLDVLEVVCVDDEGAEAGAAALEVVAGVADHEPDVVPAPKVDASFDVLAAGGLLLAWLHKRRSPEERELAVRANIDPPITLTLPLAFMLSFEPDTRGWRPWD